MTCPQRWNIETNRLEKISKYRQLAYNHREKQPEHEIMVLLW